MNKNANPWDSVLPRSGGDATADIVFTSIGRALTAWELFEMQFVEAFVVCLSSGPNYRPNAPARRAYGSVMTFRGRTDMVRAAFDAFINDKAHNNASQSRAPYAEVESEFRNLVNNSGRYAARRNEIAHGFVREWCDTLGESYGYALFPTTYNSNKNKQAEPGEARYLRLYEWPDYIYSSKEIDQYADRFRDLETQCAEFWQKLMAID